ncbi:hypothetical protein KGF51_18265 [Clostridioides sp. ZZV14-6045]|uniref:hypothetical protein n=1 Tax=unclassified Clostridioides TaxID=2635829 RepID=UPI001D0F6498|nr:hypothetical protein [Clostridioides sp. ZZV14-6045]MCC0732615.1 hypothetical protein [Clostridioides sp. ZZV14-6048]
MLKVEKNFSGSVNPNFMEDDLTYKNYLALYCCIKGMKLGNEKRVIPSADKAFSALKIKRRIEEKSKKVRLINVKTGEIKVITEDEASDFLSIKKGSIYQIIRRYTPTRSGWLIERYEED